MTSPLTHFDASGQAHMVDVAEKGETRRIARAAAAKKCPRPCHSIASPPTSRRYASWTSAVGCSVWPARSRLRWRAAMRCSSG